MILELDCGNSLIKWRVLGGEQFAPVAGGIADSDAALFEQLGSQGVRALRFCRLVSVRSEQETELLSERLRQDFSVSVRQARSAETLAGVRNGYRDYQRLGLDRWLALVAGYKLAGGSCLVIDLGTAVTSDLVSADGEHLGGYICPGMPLMRSQLRTHTRRIRYGDDAAQEALQNLLPGRETAEAVERGCLLMLRGFVREQYLLACELLGEGCAVFLTGGDAELVRDELPHALVLPDLVFAGLALACPLE
ncbi:pantothenate kinase [Pseudomonas jinjuensis]|uniref:Type III pantothenate kinase n=1 Tax=Pseudomonas jinjuensis TaxID=198616 RepID=A0A1H0NQJ7_9PSED|nr:pantothenate kinase [Pseudomonas jinjuensis]SDO95062.1 type III pantothenate kinase [Pseudomonas jinjuensis]